MDLRHKSFPAADFKADGESGLIEAVVSVFGNVDSYGEVVMLGAFAASLQRKLPTGVWMHDWTQPVAKTLEAYELAPGDERLPEAIRNNGGLYIKAQFNLETQRGREAFSDVKAGIINEFSIGYWVVKERRRDDGVIELLELDLAEWSPVLRGANPATALVSVKKRKDVLATQSGLRLAEHAAEVREQVETLLARASEAKKLREQKGKPLGAVTRRELGAIASLAEKAATLAHSSAPASYESQVRKLQLKLAHHKRQLSFMEVHTC